MKNQCQPNMLETGDKHKLLNVAKESANWYYYLPIFWSAS